MLKSQLRISRSQTWSGGRLPHPTRARSHRLFRPSLKAAGYASCAGASGERAPRHSSYLVSSACGRRPRHTMLLGAIVVEHNPPPAPSGGSKNEYKRHRCPRHRLVQDLGKAHLSSGEEPHHLLRGPGPAHPRPHAWRSRKLPLRAAREKRSLVLAWARSWTRDARRRPGRSTPPP